MEGSKERKQGRKCTKRRGNEIRQKARGNARRNGNWGKKYVKICRRNSRVKRKTGKSKERIKQ